MRLWKLLTGLTFSFVLLTPGTQAQAPANRAVLANNLLASMDDSELEAAALPCAALTAWSAVVADGQVKAGDRILVQGTGGVSLFALQFAKLLGAHVIVTFPSDSVTATSVTREGLEYGIPEITLESGPSPIREKLLIL